MIWHRAKRFESLLKICFYTFLKTGLKINLRAKQMVRSFGSNRLKYTLLAL